jgi:hypothetical protein
MTTADPGSPQYEEARQRVEAKMGFFTHLVVFAVINVVFLIVAGADWLWVTLFWGIGLALHGWRVFVGSSHVEAWKQRQIQKELGRDQPAPAAPPAPPPAPDTTATAPPPTGSADDTVT